MTPLGGSAGPEETSRTAPPDLATRQAALVAALVGDGPVPDGIDPDRLEATRRALLRKRAREAALAWPRLAASHGDAWPAVFAAHCGEPAGPLRDGWAVARHAALSPGAAAELAERERGWRRDGRPRLRPRIRRLLRRR